MAILDQLPYRPDMIVTCPACKGSGSVTERIVVQFIVQCPQCLGEGTLNWKQLIYALHDENSMDLLEDQGFIDLLNLPPMGDRHTPTASAERSET